MFKIGTIDEFFVFSIWRFFFKKKGAQLAYPELYISLFWGTVFFSKRARNKRNYYSDDDIIIGPFLFCKTSWKAFAIYYTTDTNEENVSAFKPNKLMIRLKGYCLLINFPRIIKTFQYKYYPESWTEEFIKKNGKDHYVVNVERKFGFCLSETFFQFFYGTQRESSYRNNIVKDKSWSCFIPWLSYRYHKVVVFDEKGNVFKEYLEESTDKVEFSVIRENAPKVLFAFEDYDGEQNVANTFLLERTWLRGEGRFKWLSYIFKPIVSRGLDVWYEKEVGKQKGTWKGGTIGQTVQVNPGELHEEAFKRFCEEEHNSKLGTYKIKFISRVEKVETGPDPVVTP